MPPEAWRAEKITQSVRENLNFCLVSGKRKNRNKLTSSFKLWNLSSQGTHIQASVSQDKGLHQGNMVRNKGILYRQANTPKND